MLQESLMTGLITVMSHDCQVSILLFDPTAMQIEERRNFYVKIYVKIIKVDLDLTKL